MKAHLNKLVPEARVDIGHGQMPEGQLSAVMHRFNMGEIDILLCTTIIESGLDIPNANTLIVDRADTFGLAQLYQLRGRVGRGAMRAYAYFFRHNKMSPTRKVSSGLKSLQKIPSLARVIRLPCVILKFAVQENCSAHVSMDIFNRLVFIFTQECWPMRFAASVC